MNQTRSTQNVISFIGAMKLCIIGEDRQRCQERPLLSPAAGNRRRRRQRRRRAADSLQLLWPIWPQKPEWWENRESDRGWKWRWSRPRRLQAGCPPHHPAGRQGPHVPCSSFRPRRFVGRVWPALGEQPSAAFADIFKAMSVAIPRTLSQTARHFFCSSILSFSRNRRLWLNKYGLYNIHCQEKLTYDIFKATQCLLATPTGDRHNFRLSICFASVISFAEKEKIYERTDIGS